MFVDEKISIEDLENYLESNVYMTPVEIIKNSVNKEDTFIYNYSSVILKLNEKLIDKVLTFKYENNTYELTLKLSKNRNTYKVKYLLNLIRK